jgi:dCMP deaminase
VSTRPPTPLPRPSFVDVWMSTAHLLSMRSTCSRLQVGCVITSTDYRYVYGTGYNGGAAGLDDTHACRSDQPGFCGHLHAECNAITNCRASRDAQKVVFCTHLPCLTCAMMLVNLGGVDRVFYGEEYRLQEGKELLVRAGIVVVRYESDPKVLT